MGGTSGSLDGRRLVPDGPPVGPLRPTPVGRRPGLGPRRPPYPEPGGHGCGGVGVSGGVDPEGPGPEGSRDGEETGPRGGVPLSNDDQVSPQGRNTDSVLLEYSLDRPRFPWFHFLPFSDGGSCMYPVKYFGIKFLFQCPHHSPAPGREQPFRDVAPFPRTGVQDDVPQHLRTLKFYCNRLEEV